MQYGCQLGFWSVFRISYRHLILSDSILSSGLCHFSYMLAHPSGTKTPVIQNSSKPPSSSKPNRETMTNRFAQQLGSRMRCALDPPRSTAAGGFGCTALGHFRRPPPFSGAQPVLAHRSDATVCFGHSHHAGAANDAPQHRGGGAGRHSVVAADDALRMQRPILPPRIEDDSIAASTTTALSQSSALRIDTAERFPSRFRADVVVFRPAAKGPIT